MMYVSSILISFLVATRNEFVNKVLKFVSSIKSDIANLALFDRKFSPSSKTSTRRMENFSNARSIQARNQANVQRIKAPVPLPTSFVFLFEKLLLPMV